LALIGSAYVEIRALDTNLQRDIDNAVKKIKDVTLNLQTDVNLAPVRKKIQDLRKELKNEPLVFSTEVDDSKVVDSLADAHQFYEDNPLTVVSTTDTAQMETALQSVQERYRFLESNVNANANTAAAEAQLGVLARRRTATIVPKIKMDPETHKALKGLAYAMLGAVPAPLIKTAIASVLGNLEGLAVGMAKITTVVGSAGAALLTLASNTFTVGSGLASILGIVAVAPAIFSAFGVGVVSAVLGFKDFGAALSSDAKKAAEAMAKLPPEAQAAAKSLKGLGSEIRKSSQAAFWKELGTSIQDFMKPAFDVIKKGMEGSSTATAKFVKGALASFQEFAENGGMDKLFTNINKGLESASKASKPFFDAMNTISLTGSKHLERYGEKLTAAAERFDAWATRVSESGEMDTWIREAGDNLHNLGKVIGETTNIFKGLTNAAAESGGATLADMANGLKNIADTVNGEPFHSKLVMVLEGARSGMDALGDGFGSIMTVIGNSTVAISNFLKVAGEIGGSFFNNFSKIFDGGAFGSGMVDFLFGVKKAMDDLEPTFRNIGKIMGDFGTIAAVMLTSMVPGLNNLFDTMSSVIGELKQGVIDVIPIFNEFVQGILLVAAPIAIAVADALGKVLEFFAGLPSFLQNAIIGIGLFLIILAKLKAMLMNTVDGPLTGFRKAIANTGDMLRNTFGKSSDIHTGFSLIGSSAGNAARVTGKAFGNIMDSAKIAGMYIGDGFKKSFSQFGDQLKKLGTPIKEFGSMMGKVMGEALWPQDVRNGFKQVGTKLADVARIYTGYFTAAKDKIMAIGRSIASAFPASLLGPALKALPGEIGKTFAWAGEKVASGVANMAKILAGPQVGFALEKMRQAIADHSLYASKRLEDIGKGMQNAVTAIKNAPAAIGAALSKVGSVVAETFGRIKESVATAFNSAVLAAAVHPLTAPFIRMADAAKTGAANALTHIGNMAKAVGTAVNTMTVPARTAFAGLATVASIHAGVIADRFKIAAERVGGNFATAFGNAGRDIANVSSNISSTLGRAFSGVTTAATTAAAAVSSTFGAAATRLKENFAPAAGAIRETFSTIGHHLAPAGTALREIGTAASMAAGNMGAAAGKGLAGAASGLLGVLGGPWGIALAAATVGLTMYADSLAQSKQKTDSLAASLDQASGAVTGATKNLLATNALDGATNDWDNFWRGIAQGSKSTEETLGKLGTTTQDYVDKLADSSSRDSYVKGLDAIKTAMRNGVPVTEEMAAAIGSTKEALKGVNGNDMAHLSEKAKNAADELTRAEQKIKGIAAATGTSTVQAKILSKNFETLASTTSTAADKFTALKQNLDLLNASSEIKNSKMGVTVSAEKAYQQTLSDTKTSLTGLIEKNGGLLGNLYEVGKGFEMTSQGGRDLHTALDGQSDAILKIGTSAMDQALKAGKSTSDAQAAAISAMAPGVAALIQTMRDIGLEQPEIDAVVKSFGLMPDQITTAIDVKGADEAQRKIILTKAVADAFTNGNYKAMLAALPDAAKKAIADATGKGKEYAEGDYESVLKAFDGTAGGREAALAAILGTTNGDYKAALKAWDDTVAGRTAAFESILATTNGDYKAAVAAWDATSPGRAAAIEAILKTTNGDYKAAIKTYLDQGTAAATEAGIRTIANKQYSASIKLLLGPAPAIPAGIRAPAAANGAILSSVTNRASLLAGNLPMQVKAFANGGIERHVAQIAPAGAMRLWAEPETGGEAYLPLGKSKRPRSLKILEQVAEMFGFSLVKGLKFANGGILSGMKAKSPSISREALSARTTVASMGSTTSPTVITNVYPSAGLNEEQVANSVSENIYWKLSTQV